MRLSGALPRIQLAGTGARDRIPAQTGTHRTAEFRGVRDVRTLGAVGVVELARTPEPEAVQRVVRETGVWLRPFGPWLYTMPPFITEPEEITRIVQAMAKAAALRC